MNIFPLDKYSYTFPNPLYACDEGIVAYGGDLHPNRILKAYMNGIFPWYKEGDPILWWSPNPRLILPVNEFKISKSFLRLIKNDTFEIRFDTCFEEVVKNCSYAFRKGQKGTWLLPEMIEAYIELFHMGFAHSFEAFYQGELVGGGYGVHIGDIFCGESMFSLKSNASKVAFFYLIQRLKKQGFSLVDCQVPTPHLKTLGAKEIPREEFLHAIKRALHNPKEF